MTMLAQQLLSALLILCCLFALALAEAEQLRIAIHSVVGQSFLFDVGPGLGDDTTVKVEVFDACRTQHEEEKVELGELYPTNSVLGIVADTSGIVGVGTLNNAISFVFVEGIEQNTAIFGPKDDGTSATVEFCVQVSLYLGEFLANWKELKLTYNINLATDVSTIPPISIDSDSSGHSNIFDHENNNNNLNITATNTSQTTSHNPFFTQEKEEVQDGENLVSWEDGEEEEESTATLKVYNQWFLSNTQQMTAAMLENGPERDALEQAYIAFLDATLSTSSSSENNFVDPTRRRLAMEVDDSDESLRVSFDPNTVSIVRIEDSPCAAAADTTTASSDSSPARWCQTVYGRFEVDVFKTTGHADTVVVSNTTLLVVMEKYTNATQNAIRQGDLQEKMAETPLLNTTGIVVEGAPKTVILPPSLTSSGTTNNNKNAKEEEETTTNDKGGLGLGGILGILVLVVSVLGLAAYGVTSYRKRNKQRSAATNLLGGEALQLHEPNIV